MSVWGNAVGKEMQRYRWIRGAMFALVCAVGVSHAVSAPVIEAAAASEVTAETGQRTVEQWIERMHRAPCVRPYTGTFVVLSASGAMASQGKATPRPLLFCR